MPEWRRLYVVKRKHLKAHQKREVWRKLARGLLTGKTTLERVQQESPHALHGVLKTVAWLSQKEDIPIPHALAPRVLEVVSPASQKARDLVPPPPLKVAPPPSKPAPAAKPAPPARAKAPRHPTPPPEAGTPAPGPEAAPTPPAKSPHPRRPRPNAPTQAPPSGG